MAEISERRGWILVDGQKWPRRIVPDEVFGENA